MNYLIILAMQFFRWALSWTSRELVLLIMTALTSNFFVEFRQLFLHFINLIKKRILTIFDKIETTTNELENTLLALIDKIEKLSLQVHNFGTFLTTKLEETKILLSKTLDNKVHKIKNLLNKKVLTELDQIRADINNLSIHEQDKKRILKRLDLAENNIDKVITAADNLKTRINTILDKKLTQITNKIPIFQDIETIDLTKRIEDFNQVIVESKMKITTEIDLIFSKFHKQQVKDILETQISNADENVFDHAADIVSQKVKKKIKTPDAKKIKWLNLNHNKKAHTAHAKNFKLNDIYRILVENFDRDERIALALRFAKKDHFRLRK